MKHRIVCLVLMLLLMVSSWPPFPALSAMDFQQAHFFLPQTHQILTENIATSTRNITFHWEESDLEWLVTEHGVAPKMADHSMRFIPGQPVLPYRVHHYELSASQDIAYVQTTSLSSVKLSGMDFPLYLAEKPFTFSELQGELRMGSFFPEECFPDDNFELKIVSEQGKQSLVLFVYPLYTLHGEWYMATSMTIEIGISKTHTVSSFNRSGTTQYAVVLCPDELKAPATELARLQERDGYNTRVVTLSEARKYEPAEAPAMRGIFGFNDYSDQEKRHILNYDFDTAMRIRSMLRSLLKEGQVHYLTILGDATYVPPSWYVAVEDGLGLYEKFLPTDYFYIAPEARDSQFDFDINVGRLPVRNPEEARLIVDKLRRYRQVLSPDWFKEVALMGGDPFDRDYYAEQVINEAVNNDYFKGMKVDRYFRTEGRYSTDAVLEGFRRGNYGFLWALGHGTGDALALEPGRVDAKHIMDLPAKDHLPIVVSESCVNGAFDSRLIGLRYRSSHHFKDPTSFSEAVLNSEGGGIAYIGGVRINFGGWIKEYHKGILDIKYLYYTNGMVAHFFAAYAKEPSTLGNLARQAMVQYMKEDWQSFYTHTKTFFGFTFQGDPTLKIPYMANDGKRSQPPPELSYDREMPLAYDSIPYFSMDEGIQIHARSSSPRLKYWVADYLCMEEPTREKGEVQRLSSSQHQHSLRPDRKSMMTIRVQSEDYKESRIVFYSRYSHDLVVNTEDDLTLLNQDEKKNYSFILTNDGIYPAKNIQASIYLSDEHLKDYHFDLMPAQSWRKVNYVLDTAVIGDRELSLRVAPLENEYVVSDNEASYPLRGVDAPIARIGVLQASERNSRAYYRERLHIDRLNESFRSQGKSIELCVVPPGFDEEGKSSFERLDLDMLVLYTPYFYEAHMQELFYHLEQYERQGGLVLGIMNLGQNQFGNSLSALQSYFGIASNEAFYLQQRENYATTLNILREGRDYFAQDQYRIPSSFLLTPSRSWREVRLEGAHLIATSQDQLIAMTRFGSRFFYSGYVGGDDLEISKDALQFLTDLLSIPLKDRMDVGIAAIELDPEEQTQGADPIFRVHYANYGTINADKLQLKINDKEAFDLPRLSPRERAYVDVPLIEDDFKGMPQIEVELLVHDADKDSNLSNNRQIFSYYFSSESSSTPIDLMLEGDPETSTYEETGLIQGKTTPGASLYINGQRFGVQSNGSFAHQVELKQGRQFFELYAKKGNSLSEKKTLSITREKDIVLHLRINDPICYYNYKAEQIGMDGPFIRNNISYVPLRYISEYFGASLDYISEERKVIIRYHDLTIYMIIGEYQATIIGPEGEKTMNLQGPSVIVHDRTWVPIRFIAETFGAKVDWVPILEMITIRYRLEPLEVDAVPMQLVTDEVQLEKKSIAILDTFDHHQLLYPTGMQSLEDGSLLLISSHDGIYHWDLFQDPRKVNDFETWDISVHEAGSLFRKWGDHFVFSDRNKLFVYDNSGQLKQSIAKHTYTNSPKAFENFSRMQDFQISGDYAYILNLYEGFSVIDLNNGQLVTRFEIPYYPAVFSLQNEKIHAIGFYGDVIRFDLHTGIISVFHRESLRLFRALFQDGEHFYAQDARAGTIHEGRLGDAKVFWGSGKPLSTRATYHALELFFLSRNIYALLMDPHSGETFTAQLNANFAIERHTLQETRDWLQNHPDFQPYISSSWLLEGDRLIVSQKAPADESLLKVYCVEGKLLEKIPIFLDSDEAKIQGIQSISPNAVGALIKEEHFSFQQIHLHGSRKAEHVVTQLRINPDSLQPLSWTANERHLCLQDGISGKLMVFDLQTGRVVLQFEGETTEHYPMSLSRNLIMQYFQQKLYVVDTHTGIFRVFDPRGKLEKLWNIGLFFGNDPRAIRDLKVMDEQRVVFIDSRYGDIVLMMNGAEYARIHEYGKPMGMDIHQEQILIFDAGYRRLFLTSLSNEYDKTPSLAVYPAKIARELSYPIEFSQRMVIQRWDDDTPLHIEHPKELYYEYLQKDDQCMQIVWKIHDLENFDKKIHDSIIIQTEQLSLEILVQIDVVPIKVEISPIIIKKGHHVFHPGLANKIENWVLYVELFTLQEIVPVTCTDMEGLLMISMPNDTVIINTREGTSTLMNQRGTQPFNLEGEVKMIRGRYLVPVNSLFRLLGLQVNSQQWPIIYVFPKI